MLLLVLMLMWYFLVDVAVTVVVAVGVTVDVGARVGFAVSTLMLYSRQDYFGPQIETLRSPFNIRWLQITFILSLVQINFILIILSACNQEIDTSTSEAKQRPCVN